MRLAGCIDIGGTKMVIGLADDDGTVHGEERLPTPVGSGAGLQASRQIIETLQKLCTSQGTSLSTLDGIGIVCTGPVDTARGVIKNPYTLPGWEDFALGAYLREHTGLTVSLEHDVSGALRGELFLKQLERRGKRVLMIAFGTGIGVSVYDRDHMFTAGERYAPEMGHVIVGNGSEVCYCGRTGCFESLCSGTAINRRASEAGYQDFDDLFERAQQNDETAITFLEGSSRELISGVWNLMIVFKPDVLILGGGLMQRYFDYTKQVLSSDFIPHPDFIEEVVIEPASRDTNAALIGASRLIFADTDK